MTDPDNAWNAANQASGVDAHVYAARVYDYLRTTFSLNSFDNQGSSMQSTVEDSSIPHNAQWTGAEVEFGIGDSVNPNQLPPSGAIDVVAHEWGHAVTERASQRSAVTCQNGYPSTELCYELESGALNEAFSDWMGTAVEHFYSENNWTIGENIDILRDLENPSNPILQAKVINGQIYDFRQPDTYGGQYWYPLGGCVPTQYNDWCGVHTNSGVPNKMFYLLSQGGTHNNVTVLLIGRFKSRIGLTWKDGKITQLFRMQVMKWYLLQIEIMV